MKTSNKILVSFFTMILAIVFILIIIDRLTLCEPGWQKDPIDFKNMSFQELKKLNSRYIDINSDTVSAAQWESIDISASGKWYMRKGDFLIRNRPDSNFSYQTAFYKKVWGVVKLISIDEQNRIYISEKDKRGYLRISPGLAKLGVFTGDAGSEFKARIDIPQDIPLKIGAIRFLDIECANPKISIYTWGRGESVHIKKNTQLISGQIKRDSIKFESVNGILELKTDIRNIYLTQVSTHSTQLKSKKGDIKIQFQVVEEGSHHKIISNSGDIHLMLPLGSQQHVSARTSDGKLTVFGNKIKSGSHSLGSGGAIFIIESVSGNIIIDRR